MPTRIRSRPAWSALALGALVPLAATAGCYRYVPAPGAVDAGARVRLTLTSDGAERLAARVGDGVDHVDGTMLRATGDTVTVLLRTIGTANGDMSVQGDVPLAVPRDALAGIARRELDKPVSIVAVLAGGGLLYALTNLIRGGGDGGGTDPGPPPPVQP